MIEEQPRKKPGEHGFYIVTNADIYHMVTKVDSDMKQLKQSFRLIGYVVIPVITTTITIIINSLFS